MRTRNVINNEDLSKGCIVFIPELGDAPYILTDTPLLLHRKNIDPSVKFGPGVETYPGSHLWIFPTSVGKFAIDPDASVWYAD